jgi:hypothetical protein
MAICLSLMVEGYLCYQVLIRISIECRATRDVKKKILLIIMPQDGSLWHERLWYISPND